MIETQTTPKYAPHVFKGTAHRVIHNIVSLLFWLATVYIGAALLRCLGVLLIIFFPEAATPVSIISIPLQIAVLILAWGFTKRVNRLPGKRRNITRVGVYLGGFIAMLVFTILSKVIAELMTKGA